MDQDAAQGFVYLAIALYLLPTIVALLRGHLSLLAVGLLNVVFGWTLIGWFGALLGPRTRTRSSTEGSRFMVVRRTGSAMPPRPSAARSSDR